MEKEEEAVEKGKIEERRVKKARTVDLIVHFGRP